MQTRLVQLRSQLNQLRRKRSAVRHGSAVCTLLAVVTWLLVAAFVCDWAFHLPLALRLAVLIGWTIATIWTFRRFAWPLIKRRESIEEVALLVEQHHKIDSDLVAALQFEQPGAGRWGSARLSAAVVEYVAEFSSSLDVFAGFTYQPLPRRALQLGLTLFVVMIATVAYPAHVTAFWNRFLLGSSHYPTNTRLEKITINGTEVPVFVQRTPARIAVPQGNPIEFAITCGGIIPDKGMASLMSRQKEFTNQLELNPRTEGSTQFTAEISHATDSFRVSIQLGDATSDPVQVDVVPLPLVDLSWDVTPPDYAKLALKAGELDGSSRQLTVLEGSSAVLKLICSNKPLKQADVIVAGEVIRLRPVKQDPHGVEVWQTSGGPPFESIRETLKYEIHVVDQDDLTPVTPITGQIRLKSDRQPRIVATAVTRQVLPTATPRIDYLAADDYGIAKISALVTVTREDGRSSQHEIVARSFASADQPQKTLRGQVSVSLSPFELTKGDEVKVVLEIVDWRGSLAGQKGQSEMTSFSVTDLNGILAQTGEEDKKTAKELDEILRRELGISGEKK